MLSQTAEYALRAMAWLALSPDRLVPTTELAQNTQVPGHYLAKVLQQLADARLITGRRGVGGGYKLARPAEKITLLDVLSSVVRMERISECPLGLKSHGSVLCPLHRITDRAIAAAREVFEGKSLADVLSDPAAPKPLCENTGGGSARAALTVDTRAT